MGTTRSLFPLFSTLLYILIGVCIEQYVTVLSIVFQRTWTALMKAAQVGDVNIVKMLTGAGASLKIKAEVITNIHYPMLW